MQKMNTKVYIFREIPSKFHQNLFEKRRLPPPFSFFGVSFSAGQSRSFRSTSSTACARKRKTRLPVTYVKFVKFLSDFFFRAQAVEEALRKDRDCPAEKETPSLEISKILMRMI